MSSLFDDPDITPIEDFDTLVGERESTSVSNSLFNDPEIPVVSEEAVGAYVNEVNDNSEESRIRKISADTVKRAVSNVKISFAGLELDTPWSDVIGEEGAAAMIGFGHRLQDVYRGVKQMLNVDIAEEKANESIMNELYDDEEFGTSALVGGIAGSIAEPAGFLAPGAKGKSVWEMIKSGVKIGTALGAAGYVDEESGQTRLSNALLGGTVGAGVGAGIKGIDLGIQRFKGKPPTLDELKASKSYFEREVAERKIAQPDMSWQDVVNEVRKDMPELATKAKAYAEETGEVLNPLRAARDLEVYRQEELLRPIDTIAPSERTGNWGAALNSVDRTIGIMSSRIKNIHKGVYGNMRTLEANIKIKPFDLAEKRKGFADYVPSSVGSGRKYDARKAFTKEQTQKLNLLLANGKLTEARDFILTSKGADAAKSFDDSLKLIDELGDDMIKWGVIDKKIENYWPRAVAYGQQDAFKKRVEELAANKETKVWWNDELNLTNITMAKKRKIQEVPEDMIQFYENPIEALDSYIHHAVKQIEMAKFFGKESYAAGLKNRKDTLGLFNLDKTLDHWSKSKQLEGLDPIDKVELLKIIKHRFSKAEEGAGSFLSGYKAWVNISLLANPISAATQLGDLGNSMYKNGIRNTIKAVFTRDKIQKMKEMGLEINRFAEFEDIEASNARELVDKMFKLSGFHWVDKLGKETFVQAALSKTLGLLDNMESKAFRSWAADQKAYLGSAGYSKLLKDFKAYKANPSKDMLTDEMRVYLLGELANVQPIYLSEMAQGATSGGGGKFLFTLKSFMMKQLDIIRNDSVSMVETGLKSGDKARVAEGMKNLAAFTYILGTMNIGADYLKDLMMGKEKLQDAPEAVQRALTVEGLLNPFTSFVKVFGLNEYTLQPLRYGDVESFASDWIIPPVPAAKELAQFVMAASVKEEEKSRTSLDALSRYLPLIGRFWSKGQVGEVEVPKPSEVVMGPPPVASFAEGGEVEAKDMGVKPENVGLMTHTPEESFSQFGKGESGVSGEEIKQRMEKGWKYEDASTQPPTPVGEKMGTSIASILEGAIKLGGDMLPGAGMMEGAEALEENEYVKAAALAMSDALGPIGKAGKLGLVGLGMVGDAIKMGKKKQIDLYKTVLRETKDPKAAYMASGVYFDVVDGMHKYVIKPKEFDVDLNKLLSTDKTTIADVVQGGHWKKVFKEVPELKDIPIEVSGTLEEGSKAAFVWPNREIGLPRGKIVISKGEVEQLDDPFNIIQLKSDILHEFQHGAQAYFNMSRGTGRHNFHKLLSPEDGERYNKLVLKKTKTPDEQLEFDDLVEKAHKQYRSARGEQEARFVQRLYELGAVDERAYIAAVNRADINAHLAFKQGREKAGDSWLKQLTRRMEKEKKKKEWEELNPNKDMELDRRKRNDPPSWENKSGYKGPNLTKLTPGVYQDEAGDLFKVTDDGSIETYETA